MAIPSAVADFLAAKRLVVAGVSRTGRAPANAIFRRLQQCGYEAIPVNPNATQLEGARSYPDLASVPGAVHGVVVARLRAPRHRTAVGCNMGFEGAHMVDHRVYGLLADLGPRILVEVASTRDRVANAARALALESLPFQRVPNCSLHGWFRLGKFVEDVFVLLLGILVTIKVEFYLCFRLPENVLEAHASASNAGLEPRLEAGAT